MNKKFIKYAAIGVVGYLIGFYEMKYKVVKAMAVSAIVKEEDSENHEKKEES